MHYLEAQVGDTHLSLADTKLNIIGKCIRITKLPLARLEAQIIRESYLLFTRNINSKWMTTMMLDHYGIVERGFYTLSLRGSAVKLRDYWFHVMYKKKAPESLNLI